jgi:uncharacterized protein YkwD
MFVLGWLLAWVFAVYIFYGHGSHDAYPNSCPECGQYMGGSVGWIICCGGCGWKPGKPILRWFTHSAPALRFRRIAHSPRLVLSVLAVSALFLILVSGAAPENFGQKEDVEVVSSQGEVNEEPRDEPTGSGIDEERVEQLIHEYTTEERKSRGLDALDWNAEKRSPAAQHAESMEENDYIGHTSPSGETPDQRYSGACGENVVGTSPTGTFSWKIPFSVEVDSNREAARAFVDGWMNSEGHRENILSPRYESTAVGVSHDEESGGTYAVQVFCLSD